MKSLLLTLVSCIICVAGHATSVTVAASSCGFTTTTVNTPGNMTVSNSANRGYAVFDMTAAGIPAAATITSVKVTFAYTITGSSTPTDRIYGYTGDISQLSAASLYAACSTANTMYTSSWGNSATTKTMNSTAGAISYIQSNLSGNISLCWVESASSRVYTITGTGAARPYLTIVYTCTTPSSVSISANSNPICSGSSLSLTGNNTGGSTYSWAGPNGFTSTRQNPAAFATTTLSAGVYTFTATSACLISTSATSTITVNMTPATTTGATTVCVGSTTALANTSPNGTWSSSAPTKASVNSSTGIVTGIAAGTANITYTTGCGSANVKAMTVIASPAAITGTTTVCQGLTTTLANTVTGGTWSSSNTSVATINSSTGVVGGVSTGTTTITYTNSCNSSTTTVTGRISPSAISGATSVCEGSLISLTNTSAGGTWSASNARASVDATTGVVTGVTSGASTITYAMGCGTNATLGITVSNSPNAIGGSTSVCTAASTTLTESTNGGVWSTSNAAVATVIASGRVTGVAEGTATISYTKAGCSALRAMTILTTPSSISGSTGICSGTTTAYTISTNYGTWSSSNSSVASVASTTGIVSGVTGGTATISYSTGCGSAATRGMTITTTPVAITGTTTICTGSNSTLSDATGGGTWSSSNGAVATVSAAGMVHGVAAGSTNITYAISSCIATTTANIADAPAAITGTTSLCMGADVTLGNAIAGGTWSSTNTAVATVSPAGIVTPVTTGTATISYANSCSSATAAVTVGVAPAAISGATAMCTGYNATLTETIPAGTWSSSDNAVATVNASGVVTGVNEGSATISYSLTNGCGTNVVTQPMAVSITGKWAGTSSNDWNDAGNWPCGVIPDATINVIIPAGTTFVPDIAGATYAMKDLTVNANVNISISSDAVMNVKGDLTNNGIIDGDGSVLLDNGSAQTIHGNGMINNLTLSNAAGTTVYAGDSVKVTGDLTLTAGTFNTNNGLILFATDLTMGRIAPITGGTITGDVKVMQYIQGGYRRYRFFSTPFSTATSLSQLQNNMDVTGEGGVAHGFTQTGSNAPSAFRYDVLSSNSSLSYDPGWKAITNISGSENDSNKINRYQGIRLFVRGNKGEGLGYIFSYTPSATTVSMQGPVNQGNLKVTLSKGSSANQDYNMLGNPYASPVDLGTVIYNAKAAGNITGSAYFIWNPTLGASGQFQAVPIGVGAPAPYYIQANTAYQVRAAHNGDSLNFTESRKGTAASSNLLRAQANNVSLYIYDNNNHPWDMLSVQFNNDATETEDDNYDAAKPSGSDFNFYSLSSENHKLSIDARPFNSDKVIPLGISSGYAQQFVIRAESVVIPTGGTLYLHDKLLNKYVLLQKGTEYAFTISNDKHTQGENRFELTMKPANTVAATTTESTLSLTPNPATDQVTVHFANAESTATSINVVNVTGANVFSQALGMQQTGTATISLSQLPAGIYMIEVTAGNTKKVQRLVKE